MSMFISKRGGLFILGLIFIFVILLSNVQARNFTIYNSSDSSQTYFIINGESGKIGIGTDNPKNIFNVVGDGNFTGSLYSNGAAVLTSATLNESDPFWSANYTAYNSSWSSTYNFTYNLWAYNQTIPAINKILTFGYYNLTTAPIYVNDTFGANYSDYLTLFSWNKTYADTLYYGLGNSFGFYNSTTLSLLSQLTNDLGIGNWTLDKSDYYTKTEVDTNISNANISLSSWADGKFVTNSGGDSLSGTYDFNGGWQSNGLTISGGDIYAQTGWFYQINSLMVTNLEMNGSLIPEMNNAFDLGNSTRRWNEGYFGGDVYANAFVGDGSGLTGILGSQISNNLNWLNSTSAGVLYYGISNPYSFYNSTSLQNLSQLVDNLGNRGYTSLSNFTDNILWTSGFNATGDTRWLGVNGEGDPKWTGNYTLYNSSWTTTDTEIWAVAGNGTLMFASNWNATNLSYVPYTGAISNLDLGNHNFSVGSTDFFVNSDIGRVGIGTTNPRNTLNVIGDGNFTGNLSGGAIYQDGEKVLDLLDNASIYNYINYQDILYNTSIKLYVDEIVLNQSNWNLANFVPYTGATSDVDLGVNDLSANNLNSTNVNTGSLNSDNVETGTINVTGNARITGSMILGGANITANQNGDVNVW